MAEGGIIYFSLGRSWPTVAWELLHVLSGAWHLCPCPPPSTAGPEKARFPTPQHCWTICLWFHRQAMTSVRFLSPQWSAKTMKITQWSPEFQLLNPNNFCLKKPAKSNCHESKTKTKQWLQMPKTLPSRTREAASLNGCQHPISQESPGHCSQFPL